jgi:hypothetical protein
MRLDSERALEVAAKIDDAEVRVPALDDINLVRIQKLLFSHSCEEARKTALKLSNGVLQARVLTELANKILSENKDTTRASELLSEACGITLKNENTPDKATSLLVIAQQFVKFDPIRGFEILGDAIKTLNRLKVDAPPRSMTAKRRLFTTKTYTVINGSEMTSDEHATLEAIDFSQIGPLAAQNYMQTRLLANNIEKPLLRAKFLTSVAGSVLSSLPARTALRVATPGTKLLPR